MVLRLILVGLVAGLGSNMPTRCDLETMSRSAQEWVTARLAEWDDQVTPEQPAYVYVVEPASTALVQPTQSPISDQAFSDVVGETIATFAQDEVEARPLATEPIVKPSEEIALTEPSSSLEIAPPVLADVMAMEEPLVTDVATETEPVVPTESDAALASAPEKSNDLDLAFENVLEEIVTNFDQNLANLANAEAGTSPASDTILVVENAEIAEAIIAAPFSDNTPDLSPEVSATPAVPQENQLTNAVRLTREAVVAWASLLHGPAIVATTP